MSPRSAEFMDAARRRLEAARRAAESDAGTALSAAYYAMLYAARAALSEQDEYARTHSGTWSLFRQRFVAGARFDPDLLSSAQSLQPKRERADHDAWRAPASEAHDAIGLAATLLAAVEAMLA